MTDKAKIDELLSSYLDGEMTERQLTEVKRLLANDEQLAQRLMFLQRQRELLAAMPVEQAPAELMDSIRSSMERQMLLSDRTGGEQRRVAALHLAARNFAAVAAVLVLIAGLGLLVYAVLGPATPSVQPPYSGRPMAVEHAPEVSQSPTEIYALELEIASRTPMAVNSAISRAVENLALWDGATVDRQLLTSRYVVTCDGANAVALIEELLPLWGKMGEARLTLEGREEVPVEAATGEQVVAILLMGSEDERLAAARDYAFLNSVGRELPAGEAVRAIEGDGPLATVPRPLLVSPDSDANEQRALSHADDVRVELTIVVTAVR